MLRAAGSAPLFFLGTLSGMNTWKPGKLLGKLLRWIAEVGLIIQTIGLPASCQMQCYDLIRQSRMASSCMTSHKVAFDREAAHALEAWRVAPRSIPAKSP